MISFESGCKAAFDYYKEQGKKGLSEANDLGDVWLFAGGDPDVIEDGGYAITVDKENGEIAEFILPDRKNFERLEKAEPVDIPKEYAFTKA